MLLSEEVVGIFANKALCGRCSVVMKCVPPCYFWRVVSFAVSHVSVRRASRATSNYATYISYVVCNCA